MLTGSDAVPKVSDSAPPPPPPPPFPPLLPLHADKAIRVAAANGATHVTLRRADIAPPIPNDGPARTGEPHHNARPQQGEARCHTHKVAIWQRRHPGPGR